MKAFVDVYLSQIGKGTRHPFASVEIRHLGKEVKSIAHVKGHVADATPSSVSGYDQFVLYFLSMDGPLFTQFAPALKSALSAWQSEYVNINFSGLLTRYEDLWTKEESEKVKQQRKKYDPDGLFVIDNLKVFT